MTSTLRSMIPCNYSLTPNIYWLNCVLNSRLCRTISHPAMSCEGAHYGKGSISISQYFLLALTSFILGGRLGNNPMNYKSTIVQFTAILKTNSVAGGFLWIFQKFERKLLSRTPVNGYRCINHYKSVFRTRLNIYDAAFSRK